MPRILPLLRSREAGMSPVIRTSGPHRPSCDRRSDPTGSKRSVAHERAAIAQPIRVVPRELISVPGPLGPGGSRLFSCPEQTHRTA